MILTRWMAMAVATTALVTGCKKSESTGSGPSPKEQIVGIWKHAEKTNETIEFKGDGTVSIYQSGGKLPPLTGTFQFTDDSNIEIVIAKAQPLETDEGNRNMVASLMTLDQAKAMMDGRKITIKAQVAVTADSLTMTAEKRASKYERVKQ